MVRSLFDIALHTCIQQAARISDVGNTPYHLVRPILKRLNAKQLATLEENSPSVTPESDELWLLLLEKDFPDRPLHAGLKARLLAGEKTMANKSLYNQYCDEREKFRATSAQRLRRMTEKIQKEKSKNSITPIKGIIREPIRRRVQHSRFGGAPAPRFDTKSILGKARRDMQHRLLMFGNSRPAEPPKKALPVRPPPQPTTLNLTRPNTGHPMGIYQQKPLGTPAKPTTEPRHALQSMPVASSSSTSPEGSPHASPQPERKRRAVSVFLNPKKRRLPPSPRREPAEVATATQVTTDVATRGLKSSIFKH